MVDAGMVAAAKIGIFALALGTGRQVWDMLTQQTPVTPENLAAAGGSLAFAVFIATVIFRLLAWSDKRAARDREASGDELNRALTQLSDTTRELADVRRELADVRRDLDAADDRADQAERDNIRLRTQLDRDH